MKLSSEQKQRISSVVAVAKTTIRYGFIPFVLYKGTFKLKTLNVTYFRDAIKFLLHFMIKTATVTCHFEVGTIYKV